MSVNHFLDGATRAAVFGLALAAGCGRAPGAKAPAPARQHESVLVDVAKAEDVLACAAEQYGARGYLVQRGGRDSRSILAQRETSTTREAYEVNAADVRLVFVEGNANLLRLWILSETREFPSRGPNVSYTLRFTPRSEAVELSRSVLATCSKV
jgi:hypothetical protein